jgi:hypothetical protein
VRRPTSAIQSDTKSKLVKSLSLLPSFDAFLCKKIDSFDNYDKSALFYTRKIARTERTDLWYDCYYLRSVSHFSLRTRVPFTCGTKPTGMILSLCARSLAKVGGGGGAFLLLAARVVPVLLALRFGTLVAFEVVGG